MNPFATVSVFDKFAQYLKNDQNKKPKTVVNYTHHIKRLYYVFEDDLLKISDYNVIHDLILKAGERFKWSRNTVYKTFISARRFWTWAKYREKITSNFPFLPNRQGFDYQKSPKKEAYCVHEEQSKKLWAYPFNTLRDTAMIVLFEAVGLRTAELQGLNCQDVDFRSGRREVHVKNGKRDGFRHIAVKRDSAMVLRFYIYTLQMAGLAEPQKPLFPSPKGGRLTKGRIHRIVKNRGDKEGFAAYPHAIRHGAITRIVKDHGLLVGQRTAGHSNINQTQEYTHLDHEFLREKIDEKQPICVSRLNT